MSKITRVLSITVGMVGLGAVAGALAGAVVATLVVVVTGIGDLSDGVVGAFFGAPLGAVLLPIAGWLSMRRVPIGRALLVTMLGTIAGGLLGWFAPMPVDQIDRSLYCGIIGFAIAVYRLRRASARRDKTVAEAVPLDI